MWTNLLYNKLTNITSSVNQQQDSPLDNINLNRADWDAIRHDLSQTDWDELLLNKDVEEIISLIKLKLQETCIQHAPPHVKRTNKKLHIPHKRRTMLNIKRRLNSKVNVCKYLKPPGYEDKLKKLNTRKSLLEVDIRNAIREEAIQKEIDVIKKIKTNPRAFYSYAKKKARQ